jgi:hypothetical protein
MHCFPEPENGDILESMRPQPSITEDAIPDLLRDLGSPWGDQLQLEIIPFESSNGGPSADYRVRLRWDEETYEFVAECKSRSTPKAIDQAIFQAQRFSASTGSIPR